VVKSRINVPFGVKSGSPAPTKSEKVKSDEFDSAKLFISNLSEREICLIGTALYWAEGAKRNNETVKCVYKRLW